MTRGIALLLFDDIQWRWREYSRTSASAVEGSEAPRSSSTILYFLAAHSPLLSHMITAMQLFGEVHLWSQPIYTSWCQQH
jgi:hypothetical protein